MKIGLTVSAAAHFGLLIWLLVSGFFVSHDDFDAITVTNVSIISADEFEPAEPSGPETGDAPPALQNPTAQQPAPAAPAPEVAAEAPDAPAQVAEVQPDSTPTPPEQPEQPQVVVPDEPDLTQPEGDPGASIVVPDAPRPTPRAADIIAQEVTEAPEPDVVVDDVVQREAAPDESADVVQQEAQEETAPEATTTQVVTEADEPSDQAPTISRRPGRKPTPPPAPTQVAEDAPAQDTEDTAAADAIADSIADAVSEANAENAVEDNANPGGGNGSPITRAEKGAFILAINRCWNVGALSTDALKVTVVVGFTMTPDAKPEVGSIRMVSAEGGTGSAVDRAYEAARRAIIRCGSAGFGLPADKYNQWRGVEVRFNATTKEIR